eukprot:TRINITY_DN20646_c0_g1_i2.p1 TRINITY_DN20646_c0_g1~~TRINITY_DN20646_c0_g1_i2.p1  ORF type:complete len:238 (-),score=39.06 TRINITY_DN20646_c0_g1_i2:124-837(-)
MVFLCSSERWLVLVLFIGRLGESSGILFPTDPVPCRDDLAWVANKFFNKTGLAAEIGVFEGEFAEKNLMQWKGRYYMIDAWGSVRQPEHASGPSDRWADDDKKQIARARTRFATGRSYFVQDLSVPAAKRFADLSLDWIYIDAGHRYEEVLADLEAWYPKVRWGGLVSGDDYADSVDTPMMNVSRYEWGVMSYHPRYYGFGVIRAVNEFARRKGHQLFVTWLRDCYYLPAWYFVKAY